MAQIRNSSAQELAIPLAPQCFAIVKWVRSEVAKIFVKGNEAWDRPSVISFSGSVHSIEPGNDFLANVFSGISVQNRNEVIHGKN